MISAGISNNKRRAVYRRDGWRCALCDETRYLQVHHVIPRGQGGSDHMMNLITLCSNCHAVAHGTQLRDCDVHWDVKPEDITQACTEYLADYYAPIWNPWRKEGHP